MLLLNVAVVALAVVAAADAANAISRNMQQQQQRRPHALKYASNYSLAEFIVPPDCKWLPSIVFSPQSQSQFQSQSQSGDKFCESVVVLLT